MDAATRPPITVAIATTEGWHAIRHALEPLRPQVEAVGGEILVVDGTDDAAPSGDDLGPAIRWIASPGTGLTELRLRGYREAGGDVVAMTEDHCLVADDWVEAMLRAHREYPEAAAVGGASINGSPQHPVDRASFYAGHAPWMAPLPSGPVPYLSGVNVSYKRDPLRQVLDRVPGRANETLINEELTAGGAVLVADDRIKLTHIQSRGVWTTLRLHYHAGRSHEGTRRMTRPDEAFRRALRAAVLPVPRAARRLVTAAARGEPLSRLAAATPALLVIATSQAIGEVHGALAGPGRSDEEIH